MPGSELSNRTFPRQLKILLAGGFGAGKTTFVGAISEIEPLTTEETITAASIGVDDLAGVEGKTTTTVAMDFGRITFTTPAHLVLYLFGTPGQDRFWYMWDELSRGALGAVVLADTRRLPDCFAAIEFFESRRIRFIVAVNQFDNSGYYELTDIREALDLPAHIPLIRCDARDKRSTKSVLVNLVQYVIAAIRPRPTSAPAAQPPQYAEQPE